MLNDLFLPLLLSTIYDTRVNFIPSILETFFCNRRKIVNFGCNRLSISDNFPKSHMYVISENMIYHQVQLEYFSGRRYGATLRWIRLRDLEPLTYPCSANLLHRPDPPPHPRTAGPSWCTLYLEVFTQGISKRFIDTNKKLLLLLL